MYACINDNVPGVTEGTRNNTYVVGIDPAENTVIVNPPVKTARLHFFHIVSNKTRFWLLKNDLNPLVPSPRRAIKVMRTSAPSNSETSLSVWKYTHIRTYAYAYCCTRRLSAKTWWDPYDIRYLPSIQIKKERQKTPFSYVSLTVVGPWTHRLEAPSPFCGKTIKFTVKSGPLPWWNRSTFNVFVTEDGLPVNKKIK